MIDIQSIFMSNLPIIIVMVVLLLGFYYFMKIRSYIDEFVLLVKGFFNIKPKGVDYNKKWDNNRITKYINDNIIFSTISELRNKLLYLNFGDKNRNKIFKLIITIQLDTISQCIRNSISDINIDNLTDSEFKRLLFDTNTKIVEKSHLRYKTELGEKLYDFIIMDTMKGMMAWTKLNDDRSLLLIEKICDDNNLKTNHQKMSTILLSMDTSICIIFNGYERRFHGLNGELSKILNDEKWN